MTDQEQTLDGILIPDDDNVPEKFRGKTIKDLLSSYREAENDLHATREEIKTTKEELETLKSKPNEEEEDLDLFEEEEDRGDEQEEDLDFFTDDDEYVKAKDVRSRFEKIGKKMEKRLKDAETSATDKAVAIIERRQFVDNHPELFEGKKPEEVEKTVREIAGAGFLAGKSSLEGGLSAIKEMSTRYGFYNPDQQNSRETPRDINSAMDFDSPEDELDHMVNVHKKAGGRISDTLK